MDDIASQILHGCKLARELEADLPNLVIQSQHNLLTESCEQVVETFSKAIQELTTTSKVERSSGHGFIGMEKKTVDLVHAGATIGQEETPLPPPEKQQMGSPDTSETVEMMMIKPRIGPASSTDAAVMLIGSSGESSFGASSMTSNKMKKRRLVQNVHTVRTTDLGLPFKKTVQFLSNPLLIHSRNVERVMRVPAKGVGQKDEQPDDGYIWRKYGEKSIHGAMFPRSYYRCYGKFTKDCYAKKRVQRLQEDPTTLEIIYSGIHSCKPSSSRPCNTPPTNLEHNQHSQSLSTSIQLGTWSSGEVQCSGTNTNVYSKAMTKREAECDSSGSSVHACPSSLELEKWKK